MLRMILAAVLLTAAWPGAATAPGADGHWNTLLAVDAATNWKTGTRAHRDKRRDAGRLLYRELGLQFFRDFPQDARRWQWLIHTAQRPPSYADGASQEQWDQLVEQELRPALFASSQVESEERLKWLYIELLRLRDENVERRQRGEAIDIERYVNSLLQYAAEPAAVTQSWMLSLLWSNVRWYMLESGMDFEQQRRLLDRFSTAPHPALREYAAGARRVLELQTTPLHLVTRTMEGKRISVEDFRGKVVFLDFWSTGCASCVEAMPWIKEMHARHRAAGFEVIGICMDRKDNAPKVQALLRRLDLTWETAFEPWEDTALRARFGINATPLYLLLDRDGRLAAIGTTPQDLEPVVRRLLGPRPE